LEYVRPAAIEEVKRLALMGDFSENAAYQIAKGRLRGINRRLLEIENMLKRSIIIRSATTNGKIRIGSKVRVLINGKEREYSILGSSETDPLHGIISHNSPIGQSLIGKVAGDSFSYQAKDKQIEGRIISIS
jgi:transcription elongation factor GreA